MPSQLFSNIDEHEEESQVLARMTQPIYRPTSLDALRLVFLHNPNPAFCLLCIDSHPTKTVPYWFQQTVEKELGDDRHRLEMKFVCALVQDIPELVDEYKIESFPSYILFRCGADAKELGRLATKQKAEQNDKSKKQAKDGKPKKDSDDEDIIISRDVKHVSELRRFAINTKSGDTTGATLLQQDKEKQTRETVNMFVEYFYQRHGLLKDEKGKQKKAPRVDKKSGDVTMEVDGYNMRIKCGKQANWHSSRILAYVGKQECHREELTTKQMSDILGWNFSVKSSSRTKDSTQKLKHHGFMLGIEADEHRFVLEHCNIHFLENRWNELVFDNFIVAFVEALKLCDKAIGEMRETTKQERAKKSEGQSKSGADVRSLRLARMKELEEEEARNILAHTSLLDEKEQSDDFGDYEDATWTCHCCRKVFLSLGQYQNHKESKKHKRRASQKQEEEQRDSEQDSEELITAPVNEEEAAVGKQEDGTGQETKSNLSKKKKRKFRGTPEQQERQRHRDQLRELMAQDKAARKQNGGMLPSRLGVEGYRPTGLHPFVEEDQHT